MAAIDDSADRPGGAAPPAAPPAALEELFQSHHERVFHAAYRVTGNPDDAEDVLQTVFVRLLRRGEDLEIAPATAGSYLHRAAVNAAVDLLRSRSRSGAVALDAVGEVLADPGQPGPERRRRGRELADDLRRALARLTPDTAEIFALRYFEGYANKEIAGLLGKSQTAIAVTLHRVRSRLQEELADHRGGN